jgi:glycosyltransferase involved in cell wall biosynthesis
VLTLHSDDPDYWNVLKALPPSNYGGETVCVSRHIEEIMKREHGGPSPYLIPYGVIVPEAAAAFSSNPFKVAYSGRIWEYQKRASLVVQSLIQACRQDGSLEAVMIGDGYLREACQQQVREAGLEKIITFTGQLAPRGVQQVLNDCQAILLMSDFEGLPVALLEAMAMGVVPVVRAIRSGIPELVEHEVTGLLVNEDPEVAAAAVVRLAHDQSLWQGCSRRARELVERRYRFEATYGQWQKLLAELHQSCSLSYPVNIWPGSKIAILERIFQSSQSPNSKFLLSTSHRFRTGLAIVKHCAKRILARLRSKMPNGTR